MSLNLPPSSGSNLAEQFAAVRRQTLALTAPLSAEDMMVQSLPEASPAKWHLAHTTWFFETFVLREFAPDYRAPQPDFLWLFNSYYNGVSAQPEKKLRASFSRPSLAEILSYREQVDAAIVALLDQELLGQNLSEAAVERITLGLHHEQQHQELLLTDIKHALWSNPLRPAYNKSSLTLTQAPSPTANPLHWLDYKGGLVEIGHTGQGFCFDNELPRHRTYLAPFQLASRLVTCQEYLAFIEDGGYQRSALWLSAGWEAVGREGWSAPLYWHRASDEANERAWQVFTLHGMVPLKDLLATPVCHLSYFEADAYARWRGLRLPTEAEWELAASAAPVAESLLVTGNLLVVTGNLLESGRLHPAAATERAPANTPEQLFGDGWEWTASAYLGYPGYQGYRPSEGAIGEYNGKFMSGQMVLRGGSCATPASHLRPSYRNFFAPETRWQFSGIRLAKDQE